MARVEPIGNSAAGSLPSSASAAASADQSDHQVIAPVIPVLRVQSAGDLLAKRADKKG